MNEADKKALSQELCARWRGKFNASDLAYWGHELAAYELADVSEAITRHRNTSKFVPKVREILALLPRLAGAAPQGPREQSKPEVLRRQNPVYRGKGDREVIMGYHRALWICYGARAGDKQSAKRKIERECTTDLIVWCGMTEPDAARCASFVCDTREMFMMALAEMTAEDVFAAGAA